MLIDLHASFEARNPDEAEYAQAVEANREAVWLRAHDTLDGFQPAREFPCPGSIRAVLEMSDERFVTVACDCCPWTSTVKREHVRSLGAAPEPSTPF